jgi:hypothetical protein
MSEIDFELVKTGNGYANDLAATAAKYASDTNKAVQKVSQAVSEVKREVNKLTKVTLSLDAKDEALQKQVLKLTWATAALAVAQVIVGVIQLFK